MNLFKEMKKNQFYPIFNQINPIFKQQIKYKNKLKKSYMREIFMKLKVKKQINYLKCKLKSNKN